VRLAHEWPASRTTVGDVVPMLASITPDGPTPAAVAALAPRGVLRAAINLSNFLLVSGREPDGTPIGVSPDMARELSRRLGVSVELLGYDSPGDLADAAVEDAWDVGNIGAEPARAETIAFTAPYCEIECTYLVGAGSSITSVDAVDRPGVRIASAPRAAYDLWLDRNIRHAELVRSKELGGSFELFTEQGLDALAGLRPALLSLSARLPGSRVLDGRFSSVRQAMGTPRGRDEAGFAYLCEFVEEMKIGGFVADRIAAHGVVGLSVAPSGASPESPESPNAAGT
jgi:polar amino acid transport system substrate-binding protein